MERGIGRRKTGEKLFSFKNHFWENILPMWKASQLAGIPLSEGFVGVKHHYSEQNPSGDYRERNLEHWRAGSAVKSADYSRRGPKA